MCGSLNTGDRKYEAMGVGASIVSLATMRKAELRRIIDLIEGGGAELVLTSQQVPGLELRIVARLHGAEVASRPRLTIAADGSWFDPPEGPRVVIRSRPVMRRMLLALADARRRDAGRPLSAEQLIAAGWPDQRIIREAAMRRVQVMIGRMRGLGLRDVLETREDGYLLRSDVELIREDDV